jgi:3-phosphoshikimate 1-carboxyvinyltransferase
MTVFSNAIPAEASFARIEPGQFAGGTVSLPGSKSLTNRALLISSMIPGESILRNALDCDDSRHLSRALKQLGVSISS